MNTIMSYLMDFLIIIPIIIIIMPVHEVSHGYVAYLLGDPTAKNAGRLTLNPLKHIDPFGFIAMLIVHFGWAKPVPVDSRYFKKPKRDMALVAVAGPLSNIILSFIGIILFSLFSKISLSENGLASSFIKAVLTFLYSFIYINAGFAIFNLLPIPPLDGSKILYSVLPYNISYKIQRYEMYIQIILMALLFFNVLSVPLSYMTQYLVGGLFRVAGLIPFI